MFQDFECFPKMYYCEHSIDEDIFKFIHEIDDNQKDDFSAFIDYWKHEDFEEDKEQFENRSTGYDNFEDLAYEYACASYSKEFIESGYFDFKRYEKDLEYDYTLIGEMIYSDQ